MSKVFLHGVILLLVCCAAARAEVPALGGATPKAAREIHLLELRKTKNFSEQYKRVDSFSCEEQMSSLKKNYAKQRKLFFEPTSVTPDKLGEINFPALPPEERAKLNEIFPEKFASFIAQINRPEIAGDYLPLLLSTIIRETEFQMFLDEKSTSPMLNTPGSRPGSGLVQMTAWSGQSVITFGLDNYSSYSLDRLKESIREFASSTPRRTADFMGKWVPTSIPIDSTKDKIATADQFVRSPYNPVAAFWFGRNEMERSEKVLSKMGIERMAPADRAAVIGAFYNAGANRLQCGVERVRIWNKYYSGSGLDEITHQYKLNEWRSLRGMLYMDKDLMEKTGFPPALVEKLLGACNGKRKCSCLDQEPPTNSRSVMKGYDFKGAIVTTYGDHMEKMQECFADFVQKNRVYFSPDLPEECRPDL